MHNAARKISCRMIPVIRRIALVRAKPIRFELVAVVWKLQAER